MKEGRRGMTRSTSICTEGLRKRTVTHSYEKSTTATRFVQNADGRTLLTIDQRMSLMVICVVCLFVCNVYSSISVVNGTVLIYVNGML